MSSLSIYLILIALLSEVCTVEKMRYLSTEHPQVTYFNPKYVLYFNMTSRRYGRSDPFYYVGVKMYSFYSFHNNVSVDFYFFEFLSNRYRRGFVEMHFKACDLIEKETFFGKGFRQENLLNASCSYPAGEYSLYNMTVPPKNIPHNFPFKKGRIYYNVSGTLSKELLVSGHIDMEIKEAHIRKKH